MRFAAESYSGGPWKSTDTGSVGANCRLRSGTLCQKAHLWARMPSRRRAPGLRRPEERCGIDITTPSRPDAVSLQKAEEFQMKFLLSVSRFVDAANERLSVIANALVLLSCLISAGNAFSRYAFSI